MADDLEGKDATPQLENGYVRFSTEWLEEFIRADYPGALKEFVFAVARETWGWGETWREITVPRLCELLGVSVVRVKQLREEAAYLNLVEWEPGTGPTCAGRYRVQKDYRNWIPRRVTGSWAQRHGTRTTGQDVVTGKDALTSQDVVTSNRLGRANRSLYIGVKDIERKDKDLVRIGENDVAVRTASLDPAEQKQQQQTAKDKRDADRLRQQTEQLDAALAALSDPDRKLLDTMLAGQELAKGKALTLLQQKSQADIYARELAEHGPECWRACCQVACEKQVYTCEYARGCTKHWTRPGGGNGNGSTQSRLHITTSPKEEMKTGVIRGW
ncbi:MAG: replication protein [Armatimonadia bacterium]